MSVFQRLHPKVTAMPQRVPQSGRSGLQGAANKSRQTRDLNALQNMADEGARVSQLHDIAALRQMQNPAMQPGPVKRSTATTPNRTGLPDSLKSGIESLSGMSMDHVRVYRNSDRPATVQAHAYAQGSDIHLAPGQEKHLPHEAWHVVQQAQGRVKPTRQLKGVSVNDDAGLEADANVEGAKAARTRANDSCARVAAPKADAPVQRIISVAGFQAATPATAFHGRGPNIRALDTALGNYIGAKTTVNAQALRNLAFAYMNANHQAARILAATNLYGEISTEYSLLIYIGNANAHLVDALIAQVGPANVNGLTTLAAQIGAVNANVLPALIAEVGAANLANPNLLNAVTQATLPYVGLLPTLIRDSGGIANIASLLVALSRPGKNASDVVDLVLVAGGNAGTFTRLANELALFTQTAPPGAVPGNVTVAVNAYNAARVARILNQLTAFHNAAQQMHADGVGIQGAAGNPPHLGFLGAINARIATLNGHIAALGAPPPPAHPAMATVTTNVAALRNMLNQLNNQVAPRVGLAAPQQIQQASIATELGNADTARAAVTAADNAPDIGPIAFDHFLVRHTHQHFDFGDIKLNNTQWFASANAGAAATLVENHLIGAINAMAAANNWMMPAVQYAPIATGIGGATVQIAGRAAAGFTLGQFFPLANPGIGLHDHNAATMRAIQKLV